MEFWWWYSLLVVLMDDYCVIVVIDFGKIILIEIVLLGMRGKFFLNEVKNGRNFYVLKI